jgi:hypothetical protein
MRFISFSARRPPGETYLVPIRSRARSPRSSARCAPATGRPASSGPANLIAALLEAIGRADVWGSSAGNRWSIPVSSGGRHVASGRDPLSLAPMVQAAAPAREVRLASAQHP